jgi:hypothetical protein
VLAHNTWFGYPIADANVILDLKPAKGHRILMQVFPGWIHSGTDFFVTDAGLVGSETRSATSSDSTKRASRSSPVCGARPRTPRRSTIGAPS